MSMEISVSISPIQILYAIGGGVKQVYAIDVDSGEAWISQSMRFHRRSHAAAA